MRQHVFGEVDANQAYVGSSGPGIDWGQCPIRAASEIDDLLSGTQEFRRQTGGQVLELRVQRDASFDHIVAYARYGAVELEPRRAEYRVFEYLIDLFRLAPVIEPSTQFKLRLISLILYGNLYYNLHGILDSVAR